MTDAMDTPTDEVLLLDYAHSGNRDAFGKLMQRRWADAYRLTLRVLGDPQAAEDAAQEAFVAVVRSARLFKTGRAFGPWFRTLVMNAARKSSRSRRTRHHYEDRYAERKAVAVALPEGERRLAEAEVIEHLQQLPFKVRFPLVLHFFEGCSFEEVATVLGCPRPTVQTRIRAGLDRLRTALAGAGCAGSIDHLDAWLAAARAGLPAAHVPPMPSVVIVEGAAKKAAFGAAAIKLTAALALLAITSAAFGLVDQRSGGGNGPVANAGGVNAPANVPAQQHETPAVPLDAPGRPVNCSGPGDESGPAAPPAKATVRGRVETKAGTVPAGLAVVLARSNPPELLDKFGVEGDAREGPVQRANDEGSYAFDNVKQGRYVLRACAPGFGVTEKLLDLGATGGDEEKDDLVLGVGGSIRGRAVTGDGTPAAGAHVVLRSTHYNDEGRLLGLAVAGADGTFVIQGLSSQKVPEAQGSARIFVSVEDRPLDVQGLLATRDFIGPGGRGRSMPRLPSDGELALGDIVASVLDAQLTGRTLMSGGQAVPGAHLWLASEDGIRSTVSDEQGRFAFAPIFGGKWWIFGSHAERGLATFDPSAIDVAQDARVEHDLTLAPGGAIEGVLPEQWRRSPIFVRLTALEGAPKGSEQLLDRAFPAFSATTSTDGHFRAGGLLPGSYRIFYGGPQGNWAHPQDVTVKAGEVLTNMPEDSTGNGQIHAKVTGLPPTLMGTQRGIRAKRDGFTGESFLFHIFQGGPDNPGQAISRQDSLDGETTFNRLPAGTYSVSIEVVNGDTEVTIFSRDALVLEGSRLLSVEIPWPDRTNSGAVEGQLDGEVPSEGAGILVMGKGVWGETTLAKDGSLKMGYLPPGDYTLEMRGKGLAHEPVTFSVIPGQTTLVKLTASR